MKYIPAACVTVFLFVLGAPSVAAQSDAIDPARPFSSPGDCSSSRAHVSTLEHFQTFIYSVAGWKTGVSPAITVAFSQLPVGTINGGYATNLHGYAEHYGTSVLGNVTEKLFGNFVLPSLLKQNEHYEPLGPGQGLEHTYKRRLWHLLDHFVELGPDWIPVKTSAIGASGLNALLSDTYLPKSQRTAGATATRFGIGVGVSELGDMYAEWTPELKILRRDILSIFVGKKPHHYGLLLAHSTMEYEKLTIDQQNLEKQLPPGNDWATWGDSKKLEFAGATQALSDWCRMDDGCKLQTVPQPDLGILEEVTDVYGQDNNAPSADQYYIAVKWKPGAPDCFDNAYDWGPHVTVDSLHPGMYGYSQDKLSDGALGLVVLFSKKHSVTGQFHVDFDSDLAPAAFDPDSHFNAEPNANIALNYVDYCAWYGPILAYKVPCPRQLHDFALTRAAPPPRTSATHVPQPPASPDEKAELQTEVKSFLETWYSRRDFAEFAGFIARDNITSLPVQVAANSAWKLSFDAAFTDPGAKEGIKSLSAAISYHEGALPKGFKKLQYLNANRSGKVVAPFAIVKPESLPPGNLVPRPTADRLSGLGRFLAHLQKDYSGRLYVVLYATNDPLLVRTGVAQYWILEDSGWKLAEVRAID